MGFHLIRIFPLNTHGENDIFMKLFLNKLLSNYIIKAYFIYNFKKQCKVNYLDQSSNGNFIQIDNMDFPNFSRSAANFPNSKGPGPIPKKGCESPALMSC